MELKRCLLKGFWSGLHCGIRTSNKLACLSIFVDGLFFTKELGDNLFCAFSGFDLKDHLRGGVGASGQRFNTLELLFGDNGGQNNQRCPDNSKASNDADNADKSRGESFRDFLTHGGRHFFGVHFFW